MIQAWAADDRGVRELDPTEAVRLASEGRCTTWIDIDKLLSALKLTRGELGDETKVTASVRQLAAKMPTYITLKEVKKRWGHGQEDLFPLTQFEKLWGDMTAVPEVKNQRSHCLRCQWNALITPGYASV
jgi:hypothetical protein